MNGPNIPGFAQEANEGVKPFVLSRVEAHRVNATPMAVIERAGRRPRWTLRYGTHNRTSHVMLLATEADSRRNIADYFDADCDRFAKEIKGFLHAISRSGRGLSNRKRFLN